MGFGASLQVILMVKGHIGQGQRSHWSRSMVKRVNVSLNVKGQGQQVKMEFPVSFDRLTCNVGGQRSHGSRSKDT